jgi:hypothetical protein
MAQATSVLHILCFGATTEYAASAILVLAHLSKHTHLTHHTRHYCYLLQPSTTTTLGGLTQQLLCRLPHPPARLALNCSFLRLI